MVIESRGNGRVPVLQGGQAAQCNRHHPDVGGAFCAIHSVRTVPAVGGAPQSSGRASRSADTAMPDQIALDEADTKNISEEIAKHFGESLA